MLGFTFLTTQDLHDYFLQNIVPSKQKAASPFLLQYLLIGL